MSVDERMIEPEVVNSGTLAILNKSEIDIQIATAKEYPRSIKQFQTDVMDLATLSEDVAADCTYALPRAGKMIEGPSARFAEIVASAWGNCRAGARVVNEERDFIVTQGVFHDLQKNVSITFEVKRRITDRQGKRFNSDMIATTANAACSIALRNAVLKVVPKALWNPMWEEARRTAMGTVKTLATRRANALAMLLRYGVTEEQVCAKLGVKGPEDIGLEHLATLRALVTGIKDGDVTPEEAFADEKSAPKVTSMDGFGKKKGKKDEKPDVPIEDDPTAEHPDTTQGGIGDDYPEHALELMIDMVSAKIADDREHARRRIEDHLCGDIYEMASDDIQRAREHFLEAAE